MTKRSSPAKLTPDEVTLLTGLVSSIRATSTPLASTIKPLLVAVETLIEKRTIRLETILELLSDPENGEGIGWKTYPEVSD